MRWLSEWRESLKILEIYTEEPIVLPSDKVRTFLVELRFTDPVTGPSLSHLRSTLKEFAEANDTHILTMDARPSGTRFELMLERAYNATVVNPLTDPKRIQ